jgi:putative Ca2+/H+ antiporter (TMEM165/GDT1 family)
LISSTLVATVFAVIFIAELPDKSLFASLVLGTRYKALWVWAGVSLAFIVHVVIAVAAGGILTLLPRTAVEIVVAVLFALGAYLMLRPEAVADNEHEDDSEAAALKARAGAGAGPWKVIATSFAVVFVGEWGDITQIATANLAAKYHDPLSVGLGAALGLIAVAGVAIKAGSTLLARVSIVLVRRVAGTILALFAVATLVQLLR